ncbi:hypothetical protein PFICI_10514 [Pestalotiopsis fici W106-1]|uniref:Isopropylmalate dehydrogenase-like domain-containing protein n=1 Tax=Pestalotiopsis fici (strain W106-1 / CGMCC3.15140) TaxID=1229662 RepID=W3WZ98_PESFW|nr:uncharacterized protein PFICI_10514 [Pestalotiopsis fici W106-1]ETS78452.1 hypothetical protein PFICI_10514 [Pestalotiopsis fici W106-1]
MIEKKSFEIAILPGDGNGPNLARQARRIFATIEKHRRNYSFHISEHAIGGAALDKGLPALPAETLKACLRSDAVIICCCGGVTEHAHAPEEAILKLRRALDVYANIRVVQFPSTNLVSRSSFKKNMVEDLDITFVRDMSGGAYYGSKQESDDEHHVAYDTTEYSREDIERLAVWAGTYAMQTTPPRNVHSVDKANAMATSRLWRSTVTDVFKTKFPAVTLNHLLVDDAAALLSSTPMSLNGVLLTENLFGDILSDQAGGIINSPNVLSSASVSHLPGHFLENSCGIFEPLNLKAGQNGHDNPIAIIQSVSDMLRLGIGLHAESDALGHALRRTLDPPELIGANVLTKDLGGTATADVFMETLLEQFGFFLEAANSIDMATVQDDSILPPAKQSQRDHHVRPMGVVEKIITNAAIGLDVPQVNVGDMVAVRVDWTVTSELLWAGMEKTYNQMNRPRPYRNDRIWLAVDHTVDPRTNHLPKQKGLIEKAELFQREAKIIDFLPANTSIMHTDFTRERAQPGHIVVGSDSHTCSAGSMGTLAVGFGAADVVMPLVTGETWFRVPEVCRINFVGSLPWGTSGKDVILHILGLFKRNTIAFQRAVEYGGASLKELSMDARFAIANMTTEFGGMGACFEADEITASWLSRRKLLQHKNRGLYFRADPGAQYSEERTIDLSNVAPTIALYPNPDDVVPIHTKSGMKLDGCFIGACTTTEEDLVIGGLVLEAGLKAGMVPVKKGKRRVTPGSLSIIKSLTENGIIEIYKQAGFEVGAPGCSYCVGINDVDVADIDEVWLSSQNRNFRNRMGKGSFGNITNAAAVAASSFEMLVTDPTSLVNQIDKEKYRKYTQQNSTQSREATEIQVAQPEPLGLKEPVIFDGSNVDLDVNIPKSAKVIKSRVQRFGDNVDTDAIIPAEFMPGKDNKDLGSHCFEYFRPDFRQKAHDGAQIIVAQDGFGSGSSREDAVRALQGAGIVGVIAKGFAFIYDRNQLNMGLFNAIITDDDFYQHATEGSTITVDKDQKIITICGVDKTFRYESSWIEDTLLNAGGILPLYHLHGTSLFRHLTSSKTKNSAITMGSGLSTNAFSNERGPHSELAW